MNDAHLDHPQARCLILTASREDCLLAEPEKPPGLEILPAWQWFLAN